MQTIATIGLDIAKSVFQVHGVDAGGQAVIRRQLKRRYVLAFFQKLTPCLVGIEACASAHHWSRELQALGHTVRLMPPAYVKPYVKRQKNDATAGKQLVSVATGEGSNNWLAHTYGIIERYLPREITAVRKARQQRRGLDFTAINLIHVPVALLSMFLLIGVLVGAALQRKLDDIAVLAGTVAIALLGNAFLCGVLSGPHDRYGARMVWIATLAVLIAAIRRLASDELAVRS